MSKTVAQRYFGRAANPLILRGTIDRRITLAGRVSVTHVDHVRIQGFHLAHTNPAVFAVTFDGVDGPALAACVVLNPRVSP